MSESDPADDAGRPCRIGPSTLGSQMVCLECGDECECYICPSDVDAE